MGYRNYNQATGKRISDTFSRGASSRVRSNKKKDFLAANSPIRNLNGRKASIGIGCFNLGRNYTKIKSNGIRKSIRKKKIFSIVTLGKEGYQRGKKGNYLIKKTKVLKDLPVKKVECKKFDYRLIDMSNPLTILREKRSLNYIRGSYNMNLVKCFRPKIINECNKTELLKLIRRKTEVDLEKVERLSSFRKMSFSHQLDEI